jgi:short-chain Z-isoprenyl diphosphate synthase
MFRLLYYLYARRLVREVRSRPTPRHVGIILDGNRRHGRSLGITEPRELYDLGAKKLDEVLEWCADLGIPTVTLWVFSTDNFHRPAAEVSGILASIEAKLTALACDPAIHRRRVRVRAIGCLSLLPEPVLTAIAAAERATSEYDGVELNIAVAYGGRQEIADAVRALLGCMAAKQTTLAEAIDNVTPEGIACGAVGIVNFLERERLRTEGLEHFVVLFDFELELLFESLGIDQVEHSPARARRFNLLTPLNYILIKLTLSK